MATAEHMRVTRAASFCACNNPRTSLCAFGLEYILKHAMLHTVLEAARVASKSLLATLQADSDPDSVQAIGSIPSSLASHALRFFYDKESI